MTSSAHKINTHVAMSKRKCYDVSFKLRAVDCAEKRSNEAAAREFGMDAKRIPVWCSQKDNLVTLKKNGKSRRKSCIARSRTKSARSRHGGGFIQLDRRVV